MIFSSFWFYAIMKKIFKGLRFMKNIVKKVSENSLVMWWFTLLNHLALLIYIYYQIPINYSIGFIPRISLAIVIVLVASSYICNAVKFKSSGLKLCLILLMFLISWESIINQTASSTLFHFFNILHPINLFLLVYSSISIILLGEKIGEELFFAVSILMAVTTVFFFIKQSTFIFLSLFTSFFITLTPLLLIIIYGKELKSLFKYQRRNLKILAVVLPLSYVVIYSNTIGTDWLNLFWYIDIALILFFLHLKAIFKTFQRKIEKIKMTYIKAFFSTFVLITVFMMFIFVVLQLDLKISYLFLNLLMFTFGLFIEEGIRLFKASDVLSLKEYFEILFLKKHLIVENLLTEETKEHQFSEFLHNEILQSVMAIKNFNKYSQNSKFGNQVNMITEDLIGTLRERMDYYQPMISDNFSLSDDYRSLVNRILKRYSSSKEVHLNFPPTFSLLTPYDKIVYRFVEELVTNAVKYSSTDDINLSLDIVNDRITLCTKNLCQNNTKSDGYGLKNLNRRLIILGGNLEIEKKGQLFSVKVSLPIDKEICYENFIN